MQSPVGVPFGRAQSDGLGRLIADNSRPVMPAADAGGLPGQAFAPSLKALERLAKQARAADMR
jgi:hypothetical protein